MTTRFTKKWILLCMVLSVLGLSQLGCGNGEMFVDGPVISVARRSDNLLYTVSVPKSRYALGEKVPITFSVTNESTTPVQLDRSTTGPYRFRITQSDAPIWGAPDGGGNGHSGLLFQSGETKVFEVEWEQMQGIFFGISDTEKPVERGTYSIKGFLAPEWFNGDFTSPRIKFDEAILRFGSNPIEITVQ